MYGLDRTPTTFLMAHLNLKQPSRSRGEDDNPYQAIALGEAEYPVKHTIWHDKNRCGFLTHRARYYEGRIHIERRWGLNHRGHYGLKGVGRGDTQRGDTQGDRTSLELWYIISNVFGSRTIHASCVGILYRPSGSFFFTNTFPTSNMTSQGHLMISQKRSQE